MAKIKLKHCIACARDLPEATQFTFIRDAYSPICIYCAELTPYDLAVKVQDQVNLAWRIKYQTREGRKALRVEKRQEAYAVTGKRCSSCHRHKPVDQYHACTPQPDGLQSACITCNKTRALLILQPGGRQSWIIYRDAMRASAPPKVT